MNNDLTTLMTMLNEPPPPASLKATVMARIARDADRQDIPAVAAIAPARPLRDRLVWLGVLAGLAVVVAASGYGWISTGTVPNLAAPRFAPVNLSLIPQGSTAMVIGLGLLVYLAGLFGPLQSDSHQRERVTSEPTRTE